MPCESMRQLQIQEEKDRIKKQKKDEVKRKKLEKEKRERAERTIKVQAMRMGWLPTPIGKKKFKLTKPGSNDLMEMEILEDGSIRENTPGKISMPNHESAEAVLTNIAKALKGIWKPIGKHFHGSSSGAAHTHTH